MKPLGEPFKHSGANAWGQTSHTMRQHLQVEASDVGTSLADYLGQGQPARRFTASDVGRTVETIRAPGYFCWTFHT